MKTKFKEPREKNKINPRLLYIALLLIALILAVLLIHQMRHYGNKIETIEASSAEIYERDVDDIESVVLGAGLFTAGTDIPPGRYLVTTEEDKFGSFVVYEPDSNMLQISEMLGSGPDIDYVPNVAVSLIDGQVLEIKKLRQVTFTPLATELKTELTTGIWVVGIDINPGTYSVSSKNGRSGTLNIFEDDFPVAKSFLGKEGSGFVESDTVILEEGQVIRITKIPTVIFIEQ